VSGRIWLERAWRYVRRYAFDVAVVATGIGAFFEIADQRDNYGDFQQHPPLGVPLWQVALSAFGMTLPLLARRRFPFAAPAASLLAGVAVSFIDGRIVIASGLILVLVFSISFLFGYLPDWRASAGGLAFVLAAVTTVTLNDPEPAVGDLVGISITSTLIWVGALALRQRLRQVTEAEARAQRAVDDERARIARELHDIVGHAVSVMTVQTGAVRRLLTEDQQREREALIVVEQTGRQALAEMRRLVGVLRNPTEAPALAPQPSLEHLDSLVAQVREAGLPVELRIEGDPARLPAGVDLTAYRLVQEALTNSLKHAQANQAEVVVRYGNDEVEVTVTDDGVGGLSSELVGQGLVGMRERVSVYGGELRAGPRRGGGYEMRARLPVEFA
jgi:signal transduction histidine kinase